MKDMTLNDILLRQDRPLTSVSVYSACVWAFAVPTNLTKTTTQQSFYLMSESFGLVRQGNTDPKVLATIGLPGDYIAVNQDGSYTLVSSSEYKMLFPLSQLESPCDPR